MQTVFRFVTTWAAGFVFFTLLDLLWIGVVAAPVYRSEVGPLLVLGQNMGGSRIVAALTTWLLITLSLACFALPRALPGGGVLEAAAWGAFLGLIIYGVYDLTNYAVLRGWTLKVTLMDIAWGTFACAVVSGLMYGVQHWLLRSSFLNK